MSIISAIDKLSVHKICSGQVVLDLATAVKELVENSLDAGATSVDVNFIENGIGGIEVIDNGCGIDPSNYESLALKHYTSKISNFEDLEKVLTFGFRGEALSSLCALSHVTVTTATKTQAPMGVKLVYDNNGILTSKAPISRTAGTTLQLTDIFHSLPVRRQEFKRNIKREYGKALIILQAYSIISTSVKITVSNQSGKKPSIKVLSTSKNKQISANITNIFGSKLASQIIPFNVNLESVVENGSVEGYISKPEWGLGRSSSDRQYFYVNGRPCALPKVMLSTYVSSLSLYTHRQYYKVTKAVNEVYRTFITNQYPVVIVNMKLPTDTYDVNVSPDKRTIFLHHEDRIIDVLQETLKEQMEPSRSTFNVNSVIPSKMLVEPISQPTAGPLSLADDTKAITPSTLSSSRNMVSLKSFVMSKTKTTQSSGKRSLSGANSDTLLNYVSKKPRVQEKTNSAENTSDSMADASETMEVDELDEKTEEMIADSENESYQLDETTNETIPDSEGESCQIDKTTAESSRGHDNREYVETWSDILSFGGLWRTVGRTKTVNSVDACLLRRSSPAPTFICTPPALTASDQVIANASVKNIDDNEKATKALSRVINKPDFARMEVLGQFNLGFMITSLDGRDLYIIDQHASDEKYNFETLQKTTQIKGQRLLSSPVLDLTAAEEHIVMDNVDIFKANGFDIEILSDNEPTKRIRVISQPVSKNTMFDKRDFSELIHLIIERPGEMVRCSRNRAMFASRACHKATRIGDSLNKRQMERIVQHMGEIDQPWNCPHGRPTMRHLFNLFEFRQDYLANAPKRSLTFSGTLFRQ
ncbi:hypothetical protein [Parasitella parasitica]|uniref:DNA mismatch repair protein PMS1 n=1 Tax=Parasitella parasitica TaxID=35722 RepID=A0A0B7MZ78_9FUNG|nr:hypothetical protein [Parasitella parasitica]